MNLAHISDHGDPVSLRQSAMCLAVLIRSCNMRTGSPVTLILKCYCGINSIVQTSFRCKIDIEVILTQDGINDHSAIITAFLPFDGLHEHGQIIYKWLVS